MDSILPTARWSIRSPWGAGWLRAFEPDETEILAAAPLLASFYNDRHNSSMLANTRDLTVAEVVEGFHELRAEGARPFLLEQDGELMGDADFRHLEGAHAAFALLIGPRTEQGRGLGTRYAAMLHAAAPRMLGLERIYAAVIPQNVASLRMLEKLGYEVDHSPRAASFAEDPDDICLSIDVAQFGRTHAALLAELIITVTR